MQFALTSITGMKIGTEEHKLALYADDLLVFISQPTKSFSSFLTCLKSYSAVLGYKINYSKSEAFPINLTEQQIKMLPGSFKWCPDSFKYLGINVCSSYDKVYQENYISLMDRSRADMQRWMDLPLSLIGRVNTIKMNLLPKFIYLFHCSPNDVFMMNFLLCRLPTLKVV